MIRQVSLTVEPLSAKDGEAISLLAEWYQQEWSIKPETTIQRLTSQPNDDILIQLLIRMDGQPACTGGIYNEVGLLKIHPHYRRYGPWVAQVFTAKGYRQKGLGVMLLRELEKWAENQNFKELYLYTNTAESLYARNGWITFDKVMYREKETAVMRKLL
ncbi:MAG: GNAT family N-acetyltransferase [Bacteroidetes bacterium]|nr:GNAT family N-acetyltransferase [Bacteroidota bacterium]